MPGIIRGSTMRRMTVAWLAPREKAARSISGLPRCSAAQTATTMKGSKTCTSATVTPVRVYISENGSAAGATSSQIFASTPCGPNTKAQPSVRITTAISIGARITSKKTPRQRGAIR